MAVASRPLNTNKQNWGHLPPARQLLEKMTNSRAAFPIAWHQQRALSKQSRVKQNLQQESQWKEASVYFGLEIVFLELCAIRFQATHKQATQPTQANN